MAIIVEDGTGKADANSYASQATLEAYLTSRGRIVTLTEAQVISAAQDMDNLYRNRYSGYKASEEQALEYPRIASTDGRFYIDSDQIPQRLINAQAEMAYYINQGIDIQPTVDTPGIKRIKEKVDVIETETEYMGGTSLATSRTVLTRVVQELKPLFNALSGIIVRG